MPHAVCQIINGLICAEVVRVEADTMAKAVKQGKELAKLYQNIVANVH